MVALGVLVIFTLACTSSLFIDQITVRKAKEEAIAMDFLTKYAETIKAMPFTSIVVGQPINYIYNGQNGAPSINIPPSGTWVSLNTPAYQQYFSQDLWWINNRNPQMMVTMTPNSVNGVLHDIEVNVQVEWSPPISNGAEQQVQVDFLRTKDTTQL